MDVRILSGRLDATAELDRFDHFAAGAGAIVSFVGKVRSEGGNVGTLHLDHHPELTLRSLHAIGAAASLHWPIEEVLVIHRVGDMAADEPIVLVAVAARHRREAFEACDYIVDHLKSRALLWKCETGPAGRSWIETRLADEDDIARWGDKALSFEDMLASPATRDRPGR